MMPTWEQCDGNLYTLQMLLNTFYVLKASLHCKYLEVQKTLDFLKLTMSLPLYCADAKIFIQKIKDNLLQLPNDGSLNFLEVATALDLQAIGEYGNDEADS